MENQDKMMQKFNAIMDKLNLMQKPIVQNVEHNQLNNVANQIIIMNITCLKKSN